MENLSGTVAIVTGAGSGIGRASARAFAAEGAAIVAVDLNREAALATLAGQRGVGVGVEPGAPIDGVVVDGDVSQPELWERVLAEAAALGSLRAVHLNAGVYGHTGPIEDLSIDVYQRTLDANIGGVVLGTRAVVPVLRANGGGGIVATASVAGIVAFSPNPLYTLTKQAVTGFVTAMAPNLVVDGISFDAVCPGVVDTPMTEGALGGLDPALLGFPIISAETIADVVVRLLTTEGTGRSVAVLPGLDPVQWTFPTFPDLYRDGIPLG